MAALLRLGAARRLGGSVVQRAEAAVAEGHRRVGPRLVHTDKRVAEGGKKSLKDDQASPRQDGYDWRQFPYSSALASIGNGLVKGALFITVASTVDVYRLFGIDRPEEKKRRLA